VVVGLVTERRNNPIGIDELFPRLSWQSECERRSSEQVAYEVQVALTPDFESGDLLWDSGEVSSSESTIQYAGRAVGSGQCAYWRVRIVDSHGCASPWSPTATWECGLLKQTDWTGRWIGSVPPAIARGADQPHEAQPAPYLRRSFALKGPVRRARAYATALGLYEMHVNGQAAGTELLTPGWTDYRHRIQYQAYDITSMLHTGENVVGAVLADGWYAGQMASFGPNHYGDAPAFLCQVRIDLADGQTVEIATDGSWRAAPGAATVADLLMGERVDGRWEPRGWDAPGFEDADWQPAQYRAGPGVPIVAARDDGVRTIARLVPISTVQRARDRFFVDFGQNIAGHLAIRASGTEGATLSIRHAEALDEAGDLYTPNLRTAEALDSYTFRGDAVETFEPRFTYHGFRYAELDGFPEPPQPGQVTALAISSATRDVGSFDCSDPLVNRIHANVTWGLRDNFISIPTDCPQRDERLGWAADIQVFAPSALFICDVANILEKWLVDLADAQLPSGVYPDTAPHVGHVGAGNAGWADAGVLVPWAIYERTGDRRVLERQYPSMFRYVSYLEGDHTGGIRSGGRLGDWLSLGIQTGTDLIGTAYLAWTTNVFARIARLVGEDADADTFERLTSTAHKAFVRSFVADDGTVSGDTQTGYALALGFGLLPEPLRRPAADRLALSVDANDGHLATGFLGAPLVLAALSEHGHHELACRLVRSETYPSWGYQVRHGATTVWERWNGWTPEGGFADPGMNSFNHFAFGSVADWLHRFVAGLSPGEPGYLRTIVEPRPTSEFSSARASHDSAYGRHAVAWEVIEDVLRVVVDVPTNTSAEVVVPTGLDRVAVDERRPTDGFDGLLGMRSGQRETRLLLGSGRYVVVASLGPIGPTS
jgi:alpha-L-rhamnosidase